MNHIQVTNDYMVLNESTSLLKIRSIKTGFAVEIKIDTEIIDDLKKCIRWRWNKRDETAIGIWNGKDICLQRRVVDLFNEYDPEKVPKYISRNDPLDCRFDSLDVIYH